MSNGNRLFIVSRLLPPWIGGTGEKITIIAVSSSISFAKDGNSQFTEGAFSSFGEVFWVGIPERNAATLRPITHEFSPGIFEKLWNVSMEFAEAIEKLAGPDDTIWIQDYILFPLAGMFRSRFPGIAIGLMADITFPSCEEFREVPAKWQEELVIGMLGADLISFRTKEDSFRFVQCVKLTAPIDDDGGTLRYGERLIKIGAFPTGVAEGITKGSNDIHGIQDLLDEIRIIKKRQENYQVRFFDIQSKDALLDSYRNAKRRLFLLEYDGTLTPFFKLPSLAGPDNLLLDILSNIAQNGKNSVYIVSGRDSETLEKWLGHLPVNIIAEHGAWIRYKGKRWEEQRGDVQIGDEEGETGRKMTGKGAAIRQVLSREEQDFILAIGDDRTDEDMFRLLSGLGKAWTIKVGTEASFAQYNLHTPQMVISLLGNMIFLEQQSYK